MASIVCKDCNIDKELKDFHRDCTKHGGYHPYCKACSYLNLQPLYAQDNIIKADKKPKGWEVRHS